MAKNPSTSVAFKAPKQARHRELGHVGLLVPLCGSQAWLRWGHLESERHTQWRRLHTGETPTPASDSFLESDKSGITSSWAFTTGAVGEKLYRCSNSFLTAFQFVCFKVKIQPWQRSSKASRTL